MEALIVGALLFVGLLVFCFLVADERPAKRHRMPGNVTKRGRSQRVAPEMDALRRRVDGARGNHTIH